MLLVSIAQVMHVMPCHATWAFSDVWVFFESFNLQMLALKVQLWQLFSRQDVAIYQLRLSSPLQGYLRSIGKEWVGRRLNNELATPSFIHANANFAESIWIFASFQKISKNVNSKWCGATLLQAMLPQCLAINRLLRTRPFGTAPSAAAFGFYNVPL